MGVGITRRQATTSTSTSGDASRFVADVVVRSFNRFLLSFERLRFALFPVNDNGMPNNSMFLAASIHAQNAVIIVKDDDVTKILETKSINTFITLQTGVVLNLLGNKITHIGMQVESMNSSPSFT